MMNHFICGSGNFDEEEDLWVPPPSSPRKSIRKICSHKINKKSSSSNPYSTRGLDKFATVLSDLEKKRQMIYDQMNAQEISLIRFGYSSSKGGWVPIVVKFRNQKQLKPNNIIGTKNEPAPMQQQQLEPILEKTTPIKSSVSEEIKSPTKTSSNEKKKKKTNNKIGLLNLVKWRVHYYWAMVLVLILFCLVFYGRSFAIICTSIWWYLVPSINAGELNLRRLSMKKKDFNTTRRMSSDKKMDFHGFSSFKTKKNTKTMERLSSM